MLLLGGMAMMPTYMLAQPDCNDDGHSPDFVRKASISGKVVTIESKNCITKFEMI